MFDQNFGPEVFVRFKNYWWVDTGGGTNCRRIDDLDTRGARRSSSRQSDYAYFNVSTDTRKAWNVFFHVDARS